MSDRLVNGVPRHPLLKGLLIAAVAGALPTILSAEPLNSGVVIPSDQEEPAIVAAARRNDLDAVRAAMGKRRQVDARGNDRATALIWASANHNLEMADLLLKAGADPDALNEYGVGGLDLAASANDVPLIRRLLEANANPNVARWSGVTPLMLVARAGGAEAIDLLAAAKAELDHRERHGQTALMWAAAAGQTDAVRHLIAAGADRKLATPVVTVAYPGGGGDDKTSLMEVPMGGWAPIHFAVQSGSIQTVQTLLDAGEAIDRRTEEGETPLIISLYHHAQRSVKPPYDSEVFGDLPMAEFLLGRGADVNGASRSGLTPLHAAVFIAAGKDRWSYALDEDPAVTPHDEEGAAAVRLLLAHGADPNRRLGDHRILVPGGLNRHHAEYKNISPFLLAGTMYKDGIQKIMLDSGRIDVRARETDGATLLMQAAKLNIVKTAQMLIERGADVNAVDAKGRTALHFAAMQPLLGSVRSGYPDTFGPRGGGEMAEVLLAAGAIIDKRDSEGKTPLDIASLNWPKEGRFTGNIVADSPQVAGYFFEENVPSRNFSKPAIRLSARAVLERALQGASGKRPAQTASAN